QGAAGHRTDPSDPTDRSEKELACPLCGKLMVLRTARKGGRAGSRFWGCSGYPECKGTRELEGGGRSVGSGGSDRFVGSRRSRKP
ncbi:MAG: topoisomerase DNA-binding C4 zinc finger domain-containing protein, partial [Deltaproteobacteria bacterium]|nr:topoisomerase DNA-binding C4 zinc finger domain-containing protein [Deltaproteobacteria bacterium]